MNSEGFVFRPIGVIHTPYTDAAPYQPVDSGDEAESDLFYIEIHPEFTKGLYLLDSFRYIYVIYHLNRVDREISMTVKPPWAGGVRVGLFSSRSPARPNPIGLSVVRINKIEKNRIYTSGLDAFDGTPVLDIKPYIKDLDSKEDANYGWVDYLDDREHLKLHIKGIPHDY